MGGRDLSSGQRTTMQHLDAARRRGLRPPGPVMLALCPVDERLMPSDVLIAEWRPRPDMRWLVDLEIVLAHSGEQPHKVVDAAQACNLFGALSVECLDVMKQKWVSVFFGGRKYIREGIPAW